jgi:NAD(P)-dependent dehydrogenase (short-subunit alcohol dehydrogenase family)
MEKKVWMITGCSSGFGYAIAEAAIKANYAVVATARNTDSLQQLLQRGHSDVLLSRLDVTDPESIKQATNQAIEAFGKIDVLINNAGYGYYDIFEELDILEIKNEMEVNLYGAIRMMQAVLPHMRRRRSGTIINISSIAGSVGTPGRSAYSASKFALSGISECVAAEVKDFGIRISIIEPGAFRTNFFDKGKFSISAGMNEDYAGMAARLDEQFNAINGRQSGDPGLAAKAIIALSENDQPPLRVPLGQDAVDLLRKRISLMQTELDNWLGWATNVAFENASHI